MTSNFAQRIQRGKKKKEMKTYRQTSSVHKNLQHNQNSLQFSLECNPGSNVQHCIHQKYLTNYNL